MSTNINDSFINAKRPQHTIPKLWRTPCEQHNASPLHPLIGGLMISLIPSLAIGAAYSTQTYPAAPKNAPESFAFRAKVLLDIEMDSPNLATVQALATLSAHEEALARDSRSQ
ncbi:hypothetical protein LTR20_006736 [Exophiala xenobiotica]|nr:hypothetical protein LTS06_009212 [Exophiala xenobiotica]KAK5371337.1 hypothetical protein LTS13_006714 [Exophiala xenobiotica]KAK5394821.1 hypothetical protein LTR79_007437 [Exophiala xenobiotica]KAK5413178.1 hypothetical protein LTR90_007300 [Exophiala xenobiotica]KAK5461812.1 hypothetical protein LTR20_006736 [Exophiala xenobiotica]